MSEVIVRERYLKNGKKVYEYCFELAHEGGKRRRRTKFGFATKREARAAGRQALYEYENVGEVVVDNNISYSDFLDFWIENDCKNTCKEQTIKGYEKKIKLYIKPELGAYRIKSINKDNLQAFITDLYNDGFSVNTVTSIKGLLTKSFNFAVDRNYIPASPAVNLVIPKNKQPDRPTRFKQHIFLEKDQVDKIFERFPKGTSSFIPLKIAYHTGMRPGEVFGLIWDDIDFVNKTITVNRQIQWYAGKRTEEEKKRTNGTSESNGYWYFCEPKYKSYRTIDIDDTLLDILKEEYEKQQRACEYYDEYYSHYYSDFKVTDEILRRNTVFPQNRIGETCTEHRCVRKLYIDIARSKEKYIPVMSDFYDILMAQPEEEAKDIALSLELFVNGSLNIFNHQTNVDVDNRFTVYGIRDLGTELSPITMLVMMESIQNRIVENGRRGKATWLYIDEFHVLLNSEYSAKYLQQLWKKVRKQGGLCTGITQNVVDLLQNYTATTMLANSEFVALLKQANTDSSKMAEVIGVSEAQLRFVTNTASGMGLIKCGSVVIPFDNQISKDTDLYRLYNTNIHEKIAEAKKCDNQMKISVD